MCYCPGIIHKTIQQIDLLDCEINEINSYVNSAPFY